MAPLELELRQDGLRHLLFAWRPQNETFGFRDAEHERFNFELRTTADNREEIDSEDSSKLSDFSDQLA